MRRDLTPGRQAIASKLANARPGIFDTGPMIGHPAPARLAARRSAEELQYALAPTATATGKAGVRASETVVTSHRREAPDEIALALHAPPAPHRRVMDLVDRLREVHAAMIDAIVRGAGLGRVAELAAAAVGGPVAVTSTERVRGRPAGVPGEVLAEAPVRFRDEIVGIVALLGAERPPRADASELLHLAPLPV